MKAWGYKLRGYDATYDKASFDVRVRYEDDESCVLEILEINSGITFIVELENESQIYEQINLQKAEKGRAENPYRSSRKQGFTKASSGVFVALGSASRDRKYSVYDKRHDKSMPGCNSQSRF